MLNETASASSGHSTFNTEHSTFNISSLTSPLIQCEVVPRLIRPRLLFPQLHQHVIEKRGGSETEEVRRHVLRPHRFVQENEIRQRQFGGGDAAGRLHPDFLAGDVLE